jgi:predicted GNAT family N-acyltransferase
MTLSIRTVAYASPDHEAAVALRRAVLRTPLGLDFTAEQLASEADDTHFAAFDGSRLVGAVVMTPYNAQTVKLRQMAVAPDARGHGVGAALLKSFEAHARAAGLSGVTLAARVTAQDFYARNGYTAEGDIFEEVTLPHIRMTKALG